LSGVSKAIFGEGGSGSKTEEPISGQQGEGSVNEPYDKGNEENKNSEDISTKDMATSNTEPTPPTDPQGNAPTNTEHSVPAEQKESESQENTNNPDVKDSQSSTQPEGNQNQISTEDTDKSSSEDKSSAQPVDNPSESKKDDNGLKMPHTDEEREKLMMSGNFPHDPNDHSGEPLKMHGGETVKKDDEKKDRSASVAQEGGNPHGKQMGTGEQYVKASGVAADGGDFDAANAGAGAEATRLMEEKGIKPSGNTAPSQQEADTSTPGDGPGGGSKLEKIKEKLHIGHH